MAIIKLTGAERKKVSLFFVCLFLAIVSWLFFSLSKEYVYFINTKLEYVNAPQYKAVQPLQPNTVSLKVEGTGWELLSSKFDLNPPAISLDIRNLNDANFISLGDHYKEISKQLKDNQRIISIAPDTLYFDFSARYTKRVPIILAYNIQFKKQYNLAGPLKLTPNYVIITGGEKEIEAIKFWKTDSLKLKNIDKSTTKTVSLKASRSGNIQVYPAKADVYLPVDEFTEKVIEVPLRVVNNNRFEIKLLPAKVKVTALVPLRSYSKVDKESFEAIVDLKKWAIEKYTQLPVQIVKAPKMGEILRTEPQTVDFILQ